MPTDAVWILATVPQKNFERRLITFNNKLDNIADDKFFDDYYEENDNKRLYMERILEDALDYLNIHDSVWMSSKNGHYYHVYFTCDLDSNDHAMHYLKSRGIGSKRNSAVGYIPFGLFYYNEKPDPNDPYNYNSNYFNEIKDNFLKSVTSRLTVAQVVDGVEAGAAITFDYYMYLLWSSVIAAMGIMNNAPVDVAASMCIEPLMGSVMAISFGLALWKKSVFWTGIKSLVVGIIFCLIFGYLYGMIFQIWRVAWNPPPDGTWPTSEMQSRGEYRTLIYGSVIATAGGAVLAVILLKNNIVAMTGVAIATTFMPPMVNSGLCFALATHIQIVGTWQDYENITIDGTVYHFKPAWAPPPNYTPDWMNDMRYECCILAVISIAYTFVNVFFLLTASYIILKIKEIAPIKNLMPSDHKFFSEDIKIYRAHNRKYPSNTNIGQQILEEWADISGINKNDLLSDHPDAKATQLQTLSDIVADVEADANYQTITRHAFGHKYQPQLRRRLTQPTVDNSGIINANLRNTALNNLGVYTVEQGSRRGSQSAISGNEMPGGFNEGLSGQAAPAFGFASIRRSQRNPLRYSVNSPYSVWPSTTNVSGYHNQSHSPLGPPPPANLVRNRSRSSSTASGQIYGQINNNLSSSKL